VARNACGGLVSGTFGGSTVAAQSLLQPETIRHHIAGVAAWRGGNINARRQRATSIVSWLWLSGVWKTGGEKLRAAPRSAKTCRIFISDAFARRALRWQEAALTGEEKLRRRRERRPVPWLIGQA